ncbi:MAG: thioredoxin family protein [Clostridiales bacterium]|nr:thioredoxin family protein [Clostridiales bacterium]
MEEEASLASQFDIMSVPTILYLKGNNVIDRQVGAYPVAFLRDSIRRLR